MNQQPSTNSSEVAEQWRDIPGYEGLYQASDLGRVKSLARVTVSGRMQREIVRKLSSSNEYAIIHLWDTEGRHRWRVHRLVMLAFVGVPPEGKVVNHKNGVKNDNRLENLEYLTLKENTHHAMNVLGRKFGHCQKKPSEGEAA